MTQLEGSLDSNDQGHFPPYLIPDTSSLCDSLPLVKQLTQTSKGIVIIPLAGKYKNYYLEYQPFLLPFIWLVSIKTII